MGLPAIAAPNHAEEIADLIDEVAPNQGNIVHGIVSAENVVAPNDDVSITVPLDASEPLMIEDNDPNSGMALEVQLPEEVRHQVGQVANDGSVIYSSPRGGTGAAIQILDDASARVQTVTADASGPHSFTYSFGDGIKPILLEDGSIELVEETANGHISHATVDRAWAMDANGNAVESYYKIDGDQLIQVIDTSAGNVKYPIVADPKFRVGLGLYVYLNRLEKTTYKAFTSSIAVLGSAVACNVYLKKLASVPAVSKVASYICAFASPVGLWKFFTQVMPKIAKSNSMCTEARYWSGKWSTKSVAYNKCMPLNKSHQMGF